MFVRGFYQSVVFLAAMGSIAVVGTSAAAEPSDSPAPRVVGGAPVSVGMWRDTAGVIVNGDVLCTGVLIAPNVVATAGHCIEDGLEGVILDTHTLDLEGEVIAAVRGVAYPAWDSTYDIGLVELAQPSRVPPQVLSHGCVRERFIADGP